MGTMELQHLHQRLGVVAEQLRQPDASFHEVMQAAIQHLDQWEGNQLIQNACSLFAGVLRDLLARGSDIQPYVYIGIVNRLEIHGPENVSALGVTRACLGASVYYTEWLHKCDMLLMGDVNANGALQR